MNNIETMKLALEALTKLNASPHLEDCEGAFDDEIAALRQAIEQAQQAEHALDCTKVACMGNNGCVGTCWNKDTSPPPRQPLTDEEIDQIWIPTSILQASDRQRHAFARAIEAAHGIKGAA